MMDMKPTSRHGIKGKIKVDFLQQIDVMKDVRNAYHKKILPFVAIDPRREDVYENVQNPSPELCRITSRESMLQDFSSLHSLEECLANPR
jgi:hypothetical protein